MYSYTKRSMKFLTLWTKGVFLTAIANMGLGIYQLCIGHYFGIFSCSLAIFATAAGIWLSRQLRGATIVDERGYPIQEENDGQE